MKTKVLFSLCFIVLHSSFILSARAQGTAFTYQGRLNDGVNPASGSYALRFTLYDALTGGNVVAGPLTNSPTAVSNGLFTATLDFGANFPGTNRWLEIGVRTNGNGALTTLAPRQPITPTPYAITAGGIAGGGAVLTGLNASQLASGTVADARLSANVALRAGGNAFTGDQTVTSGNVGIGTNGPVSKLHIVSGASDVSPRLQSSGTGGVGAGWDFYLGAVGKAYVGVPDTAAFIAPGELMLFGGPDTKVSLWANQARAVTIATNGNVGIGTTNPFNKLEVAGTTRINGRLNVNSGGTGGTTMTLQMVSPDSSAFNVVDSSGGPVFYIQAAPPFLAMYGDASKNSGGTSWGTFSDRRLKQGVRAFEPGLNEVLQLRPVRFRYRDDPKRGLTSTHEEVGFIAQEVRAVIPDAVTEGQDGYLSLKADPIHWAAINAIQELNAKLAEQRSENAELKLELAKLKQMVEKLASPKD